jgi:hypothetical protein
MRQIRFAIRWRSQEMKCSPEGSCGELGDSGVCSDSAVSGIACGTASMIATEYIILNHGPHTKPRSKADKPKTVSTPRIDWNAKVPDWKVEKTPQWILETFEQFKEKPKTLGELTGLVFPIQEQKK